MKKHILSLVVLLGVLAPSWAQADALRQSVVKILVVARPPDWLQPWQMAKQVERSGSGFVVAKKRIMTNAHLVSDAVSVEVSKVGDPRKYPAKVEHVGHDSEIALLTVDDEEFFKGTQAVEFGALPAQRDKVAVYGFPSGGDQLSVTEGVVSRIEMRVYEHSKRNHLCIQVDAAINPGNSGGPVFKDGKLVGISFQVEKENQGQGYLVPVPVIERFYRDIQDGHFDGVPALGLVTRRLESPQARAWRGMGPKQAGILVEEVLYGGSVADVLKRHDVLLAIDGQPIGNDGSVALRGDERVWYIYTVSQKLIGEKCKFKVLREGKELELNFTLKPSLDLIARPQYDSKPNYLIYGGLVFTEITYDYLAKIEGNIARYTYYYFDGFPAKGMEKVVSLIQVLPHAVNQGYQDLGPLSVESVNGQTVDSLKSMLAALQKPQGAYQVLELDRIAEQPGTAAQTVILNKNDVEAAMPEILKKNGIPADRSDDLK